MTQFLPTSELFVVDSDAATRDALSSAFALAGYHVIGFAEAKAFIAAARAKVPVGVLLGLHLSDKSGLAVLEELNAKQYPAPIFIISGDDSAACAVKAVKSGAFDYLVKPFEVEAMVASVRSAIVAFAKGRVSSDEADNLRHEFSGCKLLTPREREVLAEIVAGATNKEAGLRLSVSMRTIEAHRARLMEKIGARNTAHMMRIVLCGRLQSAPADSAAQA
jgi:two-component system response regulator FixJ